MPRVKLSNGLTLNFPDSMDQDQIKSAIQKRFGAPQSVQQPEANGQDIMNDMANKANENPIAPKNLGQAGLNLVKAGVTGLGEAGQNLGQALQKGLQPLTGLEPAERVDFRELMGLKNPNVVEQLAEGLGQYSIPTAINPASLPADVALNAGYSALQNPDAPEMGAAIGGASAGTFNLLNKLLGAKNPLLRAGARSTAGALSGGLLSNLLGISPTTGALAGASAGFVAPKIAPHLGITGKKPGEELIENLVPQEASDRASAGQRLGRNLSPGEATARPDITAMEAVLGKHGPAARERVRLGQENIKKEQAAIRNLYATISPTDEIVSFDVRKAAQDAIKKMEGHRQAAAEPFYTIAHQKKVAPNLITQLVREDQNISNAIDSAMQDERYQVPGELKGYPRNSIKVLDYAKRKLDSQIAAALSSGDRDGARVLNASKDKLLDRISGFSPDYKTARDVYSVLSKPIDEVKESQIGRIADLSDDKLKNVSKMIFDPSQTDSKVFAKIKAHVQQQNPAAWDTMVRNEMNRLMIQGKGRGNTGKEFFDKVLANDIRFNQFKHALSHNPDAVQKLNDMKKAFEHLINLETSRTAAGQAKTSMSKARQSVDALVDSYNEIVGHERHIKALNYMYSPMWLMDLQKAAKAPAKDTRAREISLLLAKTIAPEYTLEH